MPILPVLSLVSQEVVLNQAYNTPSNADDSDVPAECRLYQGSVDERPIEWYDNERDDHDEWEGLLSRLYTHGVRAMRLARS